MNNWDHGAGYGGPALRYASLCVQVLDDALVYGYDPAAEPDAATIASARSR